MKQWQRFWLIGILLFSTLHLLRDILQNLEISSWFTTAFAKKISSPAPLWLEATAILSLFLNIFASSIALVKKQFGKLGILTFFLFGVFAIMWAYYTFVL